MRGRRLPRAAAGPERKKPTMKTFAAFAVGLALCAGVAQAQPGKLIRCIPNPTGQADEVFGVHPITIGGHIVVGSPRADPGGVYRAGAVYMYDGVSGHLKRTIPNPEPASNDRYGHWPRAFGNKLIVPAVMDSWGGYTSVGSVYVFDPKSGALLLTIRNPEPANGDMFGQRVEVVGGNIVVSAPYDDWGGYTDAGSLYVFDGVTGALRYTIRNPEPANGDAFGDSGVIEHRGHILVNAPSDDYGATDAGSVYLFDVTGNLLLTIRNPDPTAGDRFGYGLRSVGGNIVAGAPNDDPGVVSDAGSVYVFHGVTGALLLTIPNPQPNTNDYFGQAVGRHRNYILVGAPSDDPGGIENAGSVYVFHGLTGALLLTIPNPKPDPWDRFGTIGGLEGEVEDHWGLILIGSHWDRPGGLVDAGALYVFEGFPY